MTEWATYYGEIPSAFSDNDEVRSHSLELIAEEPLIAKSLEGGTRKDDFREILAEFNRGAIDHDTAEKRILQELPASESLHRGNSHVFNNQWAERLIRSQVSRFYNQAVLESLRSKGTPNVSSHTLLVRIVILTALSNWLAGTTRYLTSYGFSILSSDKETGMMG